MDDDSQNLADMFVCVRDSKLHP